MRIVYLDGHFIPESEAKLSIYDLSVMQAAAAFEMTRSFNGQHFKLDEHLTRLWHSCRLLGIDYGKYDESLFRVQLREICHQVTLRNDHGPGEEHRLLIVASPGCAPMYKDLEGVIPHPFLYIADFPLRYTVQGFSKYFTEGVSCVTSPVLQAPDDVLPSQAKHRSRLHFHLAQQQAPAGTWPLMRWRDHDGSLWYAEAPGANIVMVKQGEVQYWPYHALHGISLQTVVELTGARQVNPAYDLSTCDELWLTGTPFCMLPVTSLDGQPIGDGTIGPVFKETLAKWSQLVGVDIQRQIHDWDHPSTLWTPDAARALTNQH